MDRQQWRQCNHKRTICILRQLQNVHDLIAVVLITPSHALILIVELLELEDFFVEDRATNLYIKEVFVSPAKVP